MKFPTRCRMKNRARLGVKCSRGSVKVKKKARMKKPGKDPLIFIFKEQTKTLRR